ncbi:glycosyltransferase [Enterocloster citroniae]|uniref:glycosyltransferase n=1 Tax=Clostridia TaxID=186801 RepID=UPI0005D30B8A|nr:glycosyltransferase [Clostridium sp. FS41]KJJ73021.1 glycosyltransferase Gtf1 [Clostridium sp. FS41]
MILFISNFVSPHTIPLCNEIVKQYKGDFYFIETRKMTSERSGLGYDKYRDLSFVVSHEEFCLKRTYYQSLIDEAEAVIVSFGSIDINLLNERINKNRLCLLMSERLFKKGIAKIVDYRLWKNILFFKSVYHRNVHLLCMGAYVAKDFRLCGFNHKHMWKFGYITETKKESLEEILSLKVHDEKRILWVGRMIWWKRPMQIIKATEKLHRMGYSFSLDIVGDGKKFKKIKRYVENNHIRQIKVHGLMRNEEVLNLMMNANIFVATSNRLEGWGAVINEAENCACAIIASKAMGATEYLVENDLNGYWYDNTQRGLTRTLEKALNDSSLLEKGVTGYHFITTEWSPQNAACRLLELIRELLLNDVVEVGKCGRIQICERA